MLSIELMDEELLAPFLAKGKYINKYDQELQKMRDLSIFISGIEKVAKSSPSPTQSENIRSFFETSRSV